MDDYDKLMRRIEALENMSTQELAEYFSILFGFNCGQSNCRRLRKRLTYRLQEMHYGGLSQADKQYLRELADTDPLSNVDGKNMAAQPLLAGTRYSREWRGKTYEVTAVGDGTFEYAGAIYRSLSAVAAAITGTHWNGKKFFGVKSCRK